MGIVSRAITDQQHEVPVGGSLPCLCLLHSRSPPLCLRLPWSPLRPALCSCSCCLRCWMHQQCRSPCSLRPWRSCSPPLLWPPPPPPLLRRSPLWLWKRERPSLWLRPPPMPRLTPRPTPGCTTPECGEVTTDTPPTTTPPSTTPTLPTPTVTCTLTTACPTLTTADRK